MILFETRYVDIVNYTIHYLLERHVVETSLDIDDIIDEIMPKYLRREQFEACRKSYLNLLDWTVDKYYHRLDSFPKMVLYSFLKTSPNLQRLKSDSTYQSGLVEKLKRYSLVEDTILENLYDIDWYFRLFLGDDFLFQIERLHQKHLLDGYLRERPELVPIYQDILPRATWKQFVVDDILYRKVEELLEYLQENIMNGNLSYLFWDDSKPMIEPKIQDILKCIMDAYFYGMDVDINREVVYGAGKVDFKFYRHLDEVVVMELKKANHSRYLEHGFQVQLPKYMKSCHSRRAYYILLCFDEDDLKRAEAFQNNRSDKHLCQEYIDIVIFDLRTTGKVVKMKNASLYLPDNNQVDKSFAFLSQIRKLYKRHEIYDYLKKVQDSFELLDTVEYRQNYIRKIHKISMMNHFSNRCNSLFESDIFYHIYEEHALQKLVLSFLQDITNEVSFRDKMPKLIQYVGTLEAFENLERITVLEIQDIFSFLKKHSPLFYKILQSLTLHIYLLDDASTEFNAAVVPCVDCKSFFLICTHMMKNTPRKLGYSIYTFFYLLGTVLYYISTMERVETLSEFIDAMRFYFGDLSSTSKDLPILFADCFVMYLLHDTEYDFYNPFCQASVDIYDKLQIYFDNLLKKEVKNCDCI